MAAEGSAGPTHSGSSGDGSARCPLACPTSPPGGGNARSSIVYDLLRIQRDGIPTLLFPEKKMHKPGLPRCCHRAGRD